jgi:hypothetical protein
MTGRKRITSNLELLQEFARAFEASRQKEIRAFRQRVLDAAEKRLAQNDIDPEARDTAMFYLEEFSFALMMFSPGRARIAPR